jgi:hypothetical protein
MAHRGAPRSRNLCARKAEAHTFGLVRWQRRTRIERQRICTTRRRVRVFHMTPTHRSIAIVSEVLILITALGTLHSMRRLRMDTKPRSA